MRVKTDARRSAIVAAAWEAFRENGFERTTMSDINARVGGSKATLYSYFASKEELFAAALDYALQEPSQEAFRHLTEPDPLAERLLRFARAHLRIRLSPDMIAVDRIMIAEAEPAHAFAAVRDKSEARLQRIARILEDETRLQRLDCADPAQAAMQFMALIEFNVRDRKLYGDRISVQQIASHAQAAVDTFLRAFAPR